MSSNLVRYTTEHIRDRIKLVEDAKKYSALSPRATHILATYEATARFALDADAEPRFRYCKMLDAIDTLIEHQPWMLKGPEPRDRECQQMLARFKCCVLRAAFALWCIPEGLLPVFEGRPGPNDSGARVLLDQDGANHQGAT